MAGDELRRRLRAAFAEKNLNPNALKERAVIGGGVIDRYINGQRKSLDAPTLWKLADYFHWPEEEVFRWAGLLRPKTDAPYEVIKAALSRGGWDPTTCEFVLLTLSRSVPDAGAVEQAQ